MPEPRTTVESSGALSATAMTPKIMGGPIPIPGHANIWWATADIADAYEVADLLYADGQPFAAANLLSETGPQAAVYTSSDDGGSWVKQEGFSDVAALTSLVSSSETILAGGVVGELTEMEAVIYRYADGLWTRVLQTSNASIASLLDDEHGKLWKSEDLIVFDGKRR